MDRSQRYWRSSENTRRFGENWRCRDEDTTFTCDVKSQRGNSKIVLFQNNSNKNINVTAQTNDMLEFCFKINKKNMDLQLVSTIIGDAEGEFVITDDPDSDDEVEESTFLKKARCFCDAKKGDLKMSMTFKLINTATKNEITVHKNVFVTVVNNSGANSSPYRNKNWTAKEYVPAVKIEYQIRTKTVRFVERTDNMYDVPRALTNIVDKDFDKKMLEPQDSESQEESKFDEIRAILNEKRTKNNYENYYHYLLWLDELKELENIEKYNMSEVVLQRERKTLIFELDTEVKLNDEEEEEQQEALEHFNEWYFKLRVPGLTEKRPSLMPGDRAIISRYDPKANVVECEHEGYIKDVIGNDIFIDDLNKSFEEVFKSTKTFNVRFITNRAAIESQHKAVANAEEWRSRLFPEPVTFVEPKKIERFFNPQIGRNAEQKAAVEHILSQTSDPAPYLVFGPPGTGKTMTIVETIIQIVTANPKHRVWVCTNSNMAADHVALQLLKYKPLFATTELFLIRANSKDRDWDIMPKKLREVSNGSSRKNCTSLKNSEVSGFRIVVSTLLHASKYTQPHGTFDHNVQVSHLFIDEAAQATEPSCLVPMKLLARGGQLVLAGDPCQLGPVIMSKLAKEFGLGMSLMEHLYTKFSHLYGDDCPLKHQYITMLVNNFRSDADILAIPNEQFYGGKLKALAPLDPLSRISILGRKASDRSIVFHSVDSKAQQLGRIPSFMNKGEFKMMQTYIIALINVHAVLQSDIGIISPYLRQVTLIKDWLCDNNYWDIEVGTVEAFQGKEKRVILVSTVRGGGAPTGDLRADLGFLVDKQRFNVAVTRAKAKLIVIGNSTFLKQDEMWKTYIERCKDLGTFLAESSLQPKQLSDYLVNLKL